jgi:hypothetical protein
MKMKSQKKQTHNTVLMESGVSRLLGINSKGDSLYYNRPKSSSSFSFFKMYIYTNFYMLEFQLFQRFSVTTKEIKHFNSLSLSLFGTGNLPLCMPGENETLLHQLGYQHRRFCLIICLKNVTILHQL